MCYFREQIMSLIYFLLLSNCTVDRVIFVDHMRRLSAFVAHLVDQIIQEAEDK